MAGTKRTKGGVAQSPDEKVEALRAATREANETPRAVRDTIRELEELRQGIPRDMKKAFEEEGQAVIDAELQEARDSIRAGIQDAESKIRKRLDHLAAAVVKHSSGMPSVEEILLAERVIRWVRSNHTDVAALVALTAKVRGITTDHDPW